MVMVTNPFGGKGDKQQYWSVTVTSIVQVTVYGVTEVKCLTMTEVGG